MQTHLCTCILLITVYYIYRGHPVSGSCVLVGLFCMCWVLVIVVGKGGGRFLSLASLPSTLYIQYTHVFHVITVYTGVAACTEAVHPQDQGCLQVRGAADQISVPLCSGQQAGQARSPRPCLLPGSTGRGSSCQDHPHAGPLHL